MTKHRIAAVGVIVLALALVAPALAGNLTPATENSKLLEQLIQQNSEFLKTRTLSLKMPALDRIDLPAPRLWVHERSADQAQVVKWVEDEVAKLDLGGGPVEFKPVQKVDTGPGKTQLRFFKAADAGRAGELARSLRERLPDITVQDMSAEYANVLWLKEGHLELWLGPDVR